MVCIPVFDQSNASHIQYIIKLFFLIIGLIGFTANICVNKDYERTGGSLRGKMFTDDDSALLEAIVQSAFPQISASLKYVTDLKRFRVSIVF